MLTYGQITAVRKNEIIVKVDEEVMHKVLRYKDKNTSLVEIRLHDSRTVTNLQRKKYFATLKDISEETGNYIEYLHDYFKAIYCYKNKVDKISMSDCSVTEAREMINIVMDFVIENGIILNDLGINRTDDINAYLYKCLVKRRCCITGKPNAEIHHCTGSRVGMGNNRNKISNKGRKLISLCREWHNKVHQEGEEEIFSKFKIYGITLNDETLKKLKISTEDIT